MESLTLKKQLLVNYHDAYVLDVDISPLNNNLCLSLSNRYLSYYDINTYGVLRSFESHDGRINCLRYSNTNSNIVYSGSSDNTVKIWDSRCTTATVKLILSDEVMSISTTFDDVLAAVAHGEKITFFDLRMGGNIKLGEYADCHNDTINTIDFNLKNNFILVSGGEDGLIYLFNTSVAVEESAVQVIFNAESPIRKISFFGTNSEGLVSLSSIETALAWHCPTAQRIGNYSTIRNDLQIDYLVDSWYRQETDSVQILTGDYTGNIKICELDPQGCKPIYSAIGGHRDQIRCAKSILNNNSNELLLVTGGEDARICFWTNSNSTRLNSNQTGLPNNKINNSSNIDRKYNKENNTSGLRYSPY
jgi:WD40 repeat protein